MTVVLDMTIDEQLRLLVKAAVKSGKESRYSIAKKADVQYRTLARWLDEDRDIKLSTADKLCQFFGVSLAPDREDSVAGR